MIKKLYYQVKQSTQEKVKPSMKVEVELIEKKHNIFGRTLCHIKPISGYGNIWVNEDTLKVL